MIPCVFTRHGSYDKINDGFRERGQSNHGHTFIRIGIQLACGRQQEYTDAYEGNEKRYCISRQKKNEYRVSVKKCIRDSTVQQQESLVGRVDVNQGDKGQGDTEWRYQLLEYIGVINEQE